MIMDPICFEDLWSLFYTVSLYLPRIFLTGSRAKHQRHVLFVYLAVSLFTKGFAWNVNFLFCATACTLSPWTSWKYSLIPQSLFSMQPWQAELLFYSDEWGPVLPGESDRHRQSMWELEECLWKIRGLVKYDLRYYIHAFLCVFVSSLSICVILWPRRVHRLFSAP